MNKSDVIVLDRGEGNMPDILLTEVDVAIVRENSRVVKRGLVEYGRDAFHRV